MDSKSSVAERLLDRRKRKSEDPDPDRQRGSVSLSSRGSGSGSKRKAKGFKGASFMNNAEEVELVVISSSDSESESESEDYSGSHSGFGGPIECSAPPASSDDNSEGSSASYIDLVETRVPDLSSSSGESESDEDDDFEADGFSNDGGVEDQGSDYEAELRSAGKEPSFDSEEEKEPSFDPEKEKKKKKKRASIEQDYEVGGCETTSRANYLRKGKRVMSDDDSDPHDHEKNLRVQKDGFRFMKEPKDFEVTVEASEDEEPDSEREMANLWAEMDCSLASSQTRHACSLDSNTGNKNDEPHADDEEESGDQDTEKSDSENELDNLWAEMNLSLALSQIGNSSSLDSQRGNSNRQTLCNHDFFLDEEIGWRCRLCSLVDIEIKDYIQPMSKFAAQRWGNRRLYGEEDLDGYGGIKLDASTDDPEETSAQGTVWDLIPGARKEMYPHQREGLEFIWKNLAGTIRLDELKGTCTLKEKVGCIVSHGPGTGKSKLALTFLQSFLARFESCKPVIIAPAGMLLTWEGEFRKWNIRVPFHNINSLDFSGNESPLAMKSSRHQGQTPNRIRMVKLLSWKMQKSILGISYNMYEKLAGRSFVSRKGKKEEMRKMLLELPTLLVLDEGHTPRNKRSQIWQALSKAQAQRRIILSGTPFQNNFEELYNVIRLVRPKLARNISSILLKSSNKKQTGNKNDEEIEKLKVKISPFVHHKGGILEKSLPGLRSCVVGFNPSDVHKKLLEEIKSTRNNFKFEHKESLLAVHPSLLLDCGLSKEEESNIDKDMLQSLMGDPKEGAKTRFLEEFIRLCNAKDEKVLVFTQFLNPLKFIGEQLCSLFGWSEGIEVLLMHGQLQQKQRQALIHSFNDPNHKSRVLIASINACSEGINLIGASRVVLVDVVWNPSVVRQAISRAYRFGQKRIVYSYHLIIRGTREWEKYRKQADKERISEMMFTCRSKERGDDHNSHAVWEDDVLEELVTHEKLKGLFERVIYHHPKEPNLV